MEESQRRIDAGFIPTRQVSEVERSHPSREGPAPGALGIVPRAQTPSHLPTGMLVWSRLWRSVLCRSSMGPSAPATCRPRVPLGESGAGHAPE
jgi:hypothetical protein